MDIAFWDLETTKLSGEGRILCGCIYSWPSKEMFTYRIDTANNSVRPWDDRSVVKQIRDKLNEHHLYCTWFGKGFDVPMLQSRLTKHGMKMLSRAFHIDLCFYAKGWRGLKPRNARLSTVAEFFNLSERKQDVDMEVWEMAGAGDKKSMDIIADRCRSDVRILYELYWKLLPFVSRIERAGI